jgi:hypothetical protein
VPSASGGLAGRPGAYDQHGGMISQQFVEQRID